MSTPLRNELQSEELFEAFMESAMSSSDDEDVPVWGGSHKGKAPNEKGDFADAHTKLTNNCFNGRDSVHNEADFERRFWMLRSPFDKMHDTLMGKEPFAQKENPTGPLGMRPLVELVACVRHVAHGDARNREDKNPRIGQSTLAAFVADFCRLITQEFGPQCLNRHPTAKEWISEPRAMESKEFPGCVLSWDCGHFDWQSCPMRLACQHQGHSKGGERTLALEAMCDHRKCFWHCNIATLARLVLSVTQTQLTSLALLEPCSLAA